MNSLTVRANAKINLGLHVQYRRPDGYHEIESVMQEIDLADEIVLTPSDKIELTCDENTLAREKSNLCVQAAQLLRTEYGLPGLGIDLRKRIPIGGGLGGGSSDAAAVVLGGLKLYGVKTETDKIIKLCAGLGSDVPFFIHGKSALATGRGERIEPVSIAADYRIILVLPKIHISTAWAYKNLNLGLTQLRPDFKFKSSEIHKLKVADFPSVFFNSFESLVFREYPVLAQIKQELIDQDALFAGMSGSGSTIFGLFGLQRNTAVLVHELQKKYTCLTAVPVV